MKYRILGKTGLRVSVIGLGTWQFGGEWGKNFTPAEATAMLQAAHDAGINFLDTAECYGDHLSESLIGQALQSLALPRDHWILATKFGHHYESFMNRTEPRTGPEVLQQLHDSLTALRTDYIDLYQYHSWSNAQFLNEDVRRVLEDAIKSGKVRHLAASISPNTNLVPIEQAESFHLESIQVVYNRLDRAAEAAVLPACQAKNLGVLARVPLASGLLSGKYSLSTPPHFAPNDVRSLAKPTDTEARLREVQRLAQEEVPPHTPGGMAAWALAWCLNNPIGGTAVHAVIPGAKNVAQVQANAAAADLVV